MTISKELIEKYHEGECSPEEKKVVEDWLFSEESDEELQLPAGEDKFKYQHEMWDNIKSVLPEQENNIRIFESKGYLSPLWRQAAAAVILLGLFGSALFYLKNSRNVSNIIIADNQSETINKDFNATKYTISLGPKSNIEINNKTGIIDFCGAMMINPKEDVEITLKGTCLNPSNNTEKVTLKKGLNYIALNYGSASNNNEVIILEEGSMMGLPPLIMKQLIQQFNI